MNRNTKFVIIAGAIVLVFSLWNYFTSVGSVDAKYYPGMLLLLVATTLYFVFTETGPETPRDGKWFVLCSVGLLVINIILYDQYASGPYKGIGYAGLIVAHVLALVIGAALKYGIRFYRNKQSPKTQ